MTKVDGNSASEATTQPDEAGSGSIAVTPSPPAVTERDVAPLRSQVESLWQRTRRADPGQGIGPKLQDANSLLQAARSHSQADRWTQARDAYRRALEPLRMIEKLNSARRGAISERESLQSVLAAAKKAQADLSSITGAETGEQAFEAGQFEKATTLWQQTRANVLVAMARRYQLSGNWPAAKQALTIAKLIDPDNAADNAAAKALAKRTGKVPSYKKWPFDSKEARRRQSATAKALGLESTTKTLKLPDGKTLELVLIPAGTFTMGSPASEKGRLDREGPQRKVTISKPFWLGKTEVTQGQHTAVTGKSPWKGENWAKENAQHAASYVTWNDAVAFCKALSKTTKQTVRLPTEAEWEYACRAGSADAYSFGDDASKLGDYAWYRSNAQSKDEKYAHPVGKKKPSAWGLHDMHGNVWEWCNDWCQDRYKGLAATDPKGPNNGSSRVLRGGCWCDFPSFCRSANRTRVTPDFRSNRLGFRVAVSVSRVD